MVNLAVLTTRTAEWFLRGLLGGERGTPAGSSQAMG